MTNDDARRAHIYTEALELFGSDVVANLQAFVDSAPPIDDDTARYVMGLLEAPISENSDNTGAA